MTTIGSLFSGIGGLELGLERAGLGPTLWQVEKEPFCRAVLEKHWPKVQRYVDVATFTPTTPVELLCGGFPCQDISSAGKGAGLAGKRSGLWFEFARVIESIKPRWVVVENVASGARWWVDQVCTHLEQLGYEALPFPISAQVVGAPHLRDRIFIIAYAIGETIRDKSKWVPPRWATQRIQGEGQADPLDYGKAWHPSDTHPQGKPAMPRDATQMAGVSELGGNAPSWPPIPDICGVDDGLPNRVDRLQALGNSVVPQCAEVIGQIGRAHV